MVYVKKGLLITIFLKKHHISNSFVRKLFIFPSPLRIEGMTDEKIHVWKVLIWILSKKCKISNNILMLWISESIKHTCSNHSWVILPCHKPSGTACQRARWTQQSGVRNKSSIVFILHSEKIHKFKVHLHWTNSKTVITFLTAWKTNDSMSLTIW